MKYETYEFEINKHLLPALFYGDYTGLTIEDEVKLDEFLKTFYNDDGVQYITFDSPSSNSFFTRCDVGGLHADCVEVIITCFFKKEASV